MNTFRKNPLGENMTKKGCSLVCKVYGSCICYDSRADYRVGLGIHALGENLDFTKIVKDVSLDKDSEVVRFLMGEQICTDHCSVSFCVSEEFSNDPQLVDLFLDKVLGPLQNGDVFPVDQVGHASLYLEPNSWKVASFVDISGENRPMFRINVSFRARIQMRNSLVPLSLDSFRDGISFCEYLHDEQSLRRKTELALGLLLHKDSLYINKDVSFACVKPADERELRKVLLREMAARKYNIYDFAGFAALLVDDAVLKERLLKYRCDNDFLKFLGPAPQTYGGRVSQYYKNGRFAVSLAFERVREKLFEEILPQFYARVEGAYRDCVARYTTRGTFGYRSNRLTYECMEGNLRIGMDVPMVISSDNWAPRKEAFAQLKEVSEQVADFCAAVLEFYATYLADRVIPFGESGDCAMVRLMDFAWEKVLLDPLLYSDDENGILATFSRYIVNGEAI